MSIRDYTRTAVLLVYISLCTRSAYGELSVGSAVKIVPQFTNVEIPWKFTDVYGKVFSVHWYYKTGSGLFKEFYSVNALGDESGDPDITKFANRVKFTGRIKTRDLKLAIEMFTINDEGEYKCTIVAALKDVSNITTLRAFVLSNITKFETSTDDFKQGDNITLSCMVTKGVPAPIIEILQRTTVLNQSVGSETEDTTLNYPLRSISRKASGSYFCRVTTGTKRHTVPALVINVKYPPVWVNAVNELYGCKDKSMTLACKANGLPTPTVQRFDTKGESIAEETFQLKEFGVYRCEASNRLGIIVFNTTISEKKDKPDKPLFESCEFNDVSWNGKSSGVIFTLQVMKGMNDWEDVITMDHTTYNPSIHDMFNNNNDYTLRVIATNCVDNTTSEHCSIEGNSPSSGERSGGGNAGAIAGAVIGVLLAIVIIVIVVVLVLRKKKQSSGGRLMETQKMTNVNPKPKPVRATKTEDLLYGNDSPDVNETRDAPPSKPHAGYAEIEDDADTPTHTNVPSWV